MRSQRNLEPQYGGLSLWKRRRRRDRIDQHFQRPPSTMKFRDERAENSPLARFHTFERGKFVSAISSRDPRTARATNEKSRRADLETPLPILFPSPPSCSSLRPSNPGLTGYSSYSALKLPHQTSIHLTSFTPPSS